MKQDYLWDKIGDDPETKRLENVLEVFRYQESTAPELRVSNMVPLVEKRSRRRFSFAFALATCAAATVILSAIVFQIISGGKGAEKVLVTVDSRQINSETLVEASIEKEDGLSSKRTETTKEKVTRHRTEIRRPMGLTTRRPRAASRIRETKKTTVALTPEERYAYGQLMLALSITGSKLKIVHDAINGIEDKENAAVKNER